MEIALKPGHATTRMMFKGMLDLELISKPNLIKGNFTTLVIGYCGVDGSNATHRAMLGWHQGRVSQTAGLTTWIYLESKRGHKV